MVQEHVSYKTASSLRTNMILYFLFKLLKLNFQHFTLLAWKMVDINKIIPLIVTEAQIKKCNFPANNKIKLIENVMDMFSF